MQKVSKEEAFLKIFLFKMIGNVSNVRSCFYFSPLNFYDLHIVCQSKARPTEGTDCLVNKVENIVV